MSTDFASSGAQQDEFHLSQDVAAYDDMAEEAASTSDNHISGTALRRRFVTPESIAALATAEKPSLLQRFLRRR